MKLPQLLEVSARNFRDHDPVWLGKRPSGGRFGGGGAIGGEIAPQPPKHVSFDTARSDRHLTLELLMRVGGTDCWRSNEERYLASGRLAASDRDLAAAGYDTCGRISAKATTRTIGEKTDKGSITSKK